MYIYKLKSKGEFNMSEFKDALDEILAKHEAAAKGESIQRVEVTPSSTSTVPPVPENPILPFTEEDNSSIDDIDYGDNDLDDEIAAENEAEEIARTEAMAERQKMVDDKKTIMPPDSKDPNVMADFANYQTEKVAIVTTMVNKVIAKYHITEGGIQDATDINSGIKCKREVMGDLIEYYDTHDNNEITPEFEAIILNNWIMDNGQTAASWIKNPPPVDTSKESAKEEKPVVQVNENLDVIPQININIPEGSDIVINVDSDVVRNMSETKKIDILVTKVSEKELKSEIIRNTQQKGILEAYETGMNDTPLTLPMSAYRCVIKPMNYFDFFRLVSPSSQNRSDDELKKWSVIYKQIKNPSIGAFSSFDDFLKKTKYQDKDFLMWGLLLATADEDEQLKFTCDNPKCKHELILKYRPRDIIRLDETKMPKYYNRVHDASALEDAQEVFDEVSNTHTKYTLPSEKFKVEICEPSAYDFINSKIKLMNALLKRYVPDGNLENMNEETLSKPDMMEFDFLMAHALYVSSISVLKVKNICLITGMILRRS